MFWAACETKAFYRLLALISSYLMGAQLSKVVGGGVYYLPGTIGRLWAERVGALTAAEAYEPMRLKRELFTSLLRDEWLATTVRDVVDQAKQGEFHEDLREEAPGVYSFDLFSGTFCEDLLAEMDHYSASGLPIRRPNSMNNYGLIVNEIGMRDAVSELQREILLPIARLLFPKEGSDFQAHHSFTVAYKKTEDAGLDMHTDDSDVTVNVCLGKDFEGAGLTFCGASGTPEHRHFAFQYKHVTGRAVVHLGSKRHGADDIRSGERRNLIIWNHNKVWRDSDEYQTRMRRYEKEAGEPDPRCLSFTHDRDFGSYKDYPPGTKERSYRAWCPPRRACYDTMGQHIQEDPNRVERPAHWP